MVFIFPECNCTVGLVRALGLCNFNTSQISRILKVAKVMPAVHQVESNPRIHNEIMRWGKRSFLLNFFLALMSTTTSCFYCSWPAQHPFPPPPKKTAFVLVFNGVF